MGRDGYYWSVDDCCWVPCPQPAATELVTTEQPVVVDAETT